MNFWTISHLPIGGFGFFFGKSRFDVQSWHPSLYRNPMQFMFIAPLPHTKYYKKYAPFVSGIFAPFRLGMFPLNNHPIRGSLVIAVQDRHVQNSSDSWWTNQLFVWSEILPFFSLALTPHNLLLWDVKLIPTAAADPGFVRGANLSVADPGFPEVGDGGQHTILPNFH